MSQNFNDYISYDEFCERTGLHGKQAIEFLLCELRKLREEKTRNEPTTASAISK